MVRDTDRVLINVRPIILNPIFISERVSDCINLHGFAWILLVALMGLAYADSLINHMRLKYSTTLVDRLRRDIAHIIC